MTTRVKKRALMTVIVAACAMVAMLLPMVASTSEDSPREIRLVARDMSFYLEGQPEPNPTIVVRAGERLKIHLRNDDAGMRHDFKVSAWAAGTRILEDRGEEDTVTIDVPSTRGTTTYHCTPHAKMMSGTLRIE